MPNATLPDAGDDAGSSSLPDPPRPDRTGLTQVMLTAAIVVAPFLASAVGIRLAWGSGLALDRSAARPGVLPGGRGCRFEWRKQAIPERDVPAR